MTNTYFEQSTAPFPEIETATPNVVCYASDKDKNRSPDLLRACPPLTSRADFIPHSSGLFSEFLSGCASFCSKVGFLWSVLSRF